MLELLRQGFQRPHCGEGLAGALGSLRWQWQCWGCVEKCSDCVGASTTSGVAEEMLPSLLMLSLLLIAFIFLSSNTEMPKSNQGRAWHLMSDTVLGVQGRGGHICCSP